MDGDEDIRLARGKEGSVGWMFVERALLSMTMPTLVPAIRLGLESIANHRRHAIVAQNRRSAIFV